MDVMTVAKATVDEAADFYGAVRAVAAAAAQMLRDTDRAVARDYVERLCGHAFDAAADRLDVEDADATLPL